MSTRRVLMVIKNTDLLKVCWQIMSSINVEVFARADYGTLQTDIKTFAPAIILIDSRCFPDDKTTIDEIRAATESRQIPILFLIDDYKHEFLTHKTKRDHVLVKPFSLDELIAHVSEAISERAKKESLGLTG